MLSVSYSILCLIFLDKILFCMGASKQTVLYARQFMQIILLGNVFTHLYMGLNNVMRASGSPRKAMITTLLTVGVNLLLAPLFIFVFRWGIRGLLWQPSAHRLSAPCWSSCTFPGKTTPSISALDVLNPAEDHTGNIFYWFAQLHHSLLRQLYRCP